MFLFRASDKLLPFARVNVGALTWHEHSEYSPWHELCEVFCNGTSRSVLQRPEQSELLSYGTSEAISPFGISKAKSSHMSRAKCFSFAIKMGVLLLAQMKQSVARAK